MSDEIRVGDEFEIRVAIATGPDGTGDYRVRSRGGSVAYVSSAFLADGRRIPRPIKAGDDVHLRAAGGIRRPVHVEAVIGEWAAIQRPGICRPEIASLSDLTPIPGDEK